MTDEPGRRRWQRLEALWASVHGLAEDERAKLLDTLAPDDAPLRAEIETLVANTNPAESFFQRFAAVVAAGADDAVNASPFEELRSALAGRYGLDRVLGHGGMGTVYLARELRHDRPVAIKVLAPGLAATLGAGRFLREIEIAARLHHPHILPVFDSGEAGALLYYVMPYEAGPTLRERLLRDGPLPVGDAIRILRDVVDALAYAHEHGIVHRDIKPENVLLSARHAAVTDFGVATALAEATRDLSAADAGLVAGTPRYMAPEVISGAADVDQRADLYAVGIMAYEVLAGAPPFTGDVDAVIAAHRAQTPVPLAVHRPDVPPALAELVMTCLEKSPARRWQRADALLERIEALDLRLFDDDDDATSPVASRVRAPARWIVLAAAMAALLLLRGSGGPGTVALPDPATGPLIAVLPLTSPGTAEDSALADGMTVEVVSRLAAAGLRPVSSSSIFAFRQRHSDLRGIADSLSVPWILEGHWQRIGRDFRVHLALRETRSGATVWSGTWPAESAEILRVQDGIALTVVREVGARTGIEPRVGPGRRGTADPAANEHYRLGSDERVFRTDSAARRAIDHFRQAIALDSTFAGAWAGLAQLHIRIAPADAPDMPIGERLALAERFVLRALELDDSLAEAHRTLGNVRLRQYRFAEAERHFRRAILLDPHEALGHEALVRVNVFLGRWQDALDWATVAVRIDPLVPAHRAELARAHLVNGRCDLALEQLDHIATLVPPVGRARLVAAQCHALAGRWPEAIAQLADPRAIDGIALLGFILARAGRHDEAVALLGELEQARQRNGGGAFGVAIIHTGLQNYDEAFAWLHRAIDDYSLTWLIMEPIFADLHADPRFAGVRRRLGLQNR